MVILTIFYKRAIMISVPLTKAKARISELVARLINMKEHIVITRHGKPVAALVPYADWEKLATAGNRGLASVLPPIEVSEAEVERMVAEIYEDRARSRPRKPAF